MDVIKRLFASRKFLAALGVVAFSLLHEFGINVSEDTVNKVFSIGAIFIMGTAAEDFAKKWGQTPEGTP